MTPDELATLRHALEAGDLQHGQILELLELAEGQATEIASLEKQVQLALTWTRAHYNGKRKAEKELLTCVKQVVRDSAKLARRWPKNELANILSAKPTKEQQQLAHQVAGGIELYILKQIEVESHTR